jgi:hypothetical protein
MRHPQAFRTRYSSHEEDAMARFLFTYRVPRDYKPGPKTGTAWLTWFESMGASRVDPGHGVIDVRSLGNLGPDTRTNGYSVITAESLDAALAVAAGCPALGFGGGIEVGEIPDTSAQQRLLAEIQSASSTPAETSSE